MDLGDLNPKRLIHYGSEGVKAVEGAARKGVEAIEAAPGAAVDGLKSLLPDQVLIKPNLPPYTPLPAAERVAAEQRSVGRTHPQEFITDKNGHPHEPVNLVVKGTKAELVQALEKAGWTRAAELTTSSGFKTALTAVDKLTHFDAIHDYNYQASPVSPMYLHGKRYELAFNKNNDHNTGRDHLRIFASGTDSQGRPIWEIAATRDTGLKLGTQSHGHQIDHHIDPERDMVMADLLQSGEVHAWHVARSETAADDPRYGDYTTDRKLYQVELASHPDLVLDERHHENLAHRLMDHAPQPVQDLEHKVDQTLTNFFKSIN